MSKKSGAIIGTFQRHRTNYLIINYVIINAAIKEGANSTDCIIHLTCGTESCYKTSREIFLRKHIRSHKKNLFSISEQQINTVMAEAFPDEPRFNFPSIADELGIRDGNPARVNPEEALAVPPPLSHDQLRREYMERIRNR